MKAIHPLGDAAALVYLHSEDEAFAFAGAIQDSRQGWLVDVVQAYTSVAVYFRLEEIDYDSVRIFLNELKVSSSDSMSTTPLPAKVIPCCYELTLDMDRVASATGLSSVEIIRLHA